VEPILKAQFAARLKVSKARVTQMVQMGMPTTPEGKINVPDALAWIEEHIDSSHQRSRGQHHDPQKVHGLCHGSSVTAVV